MQGLRNLRNEAYDRYAAVTKVERNAADGLFAKPAKKKGLSPQDRPFSFSQKVAVIK
jgi:hypothetical protein